jgi:hypothetical protein
MPNPALEMTDVQIVDAQIDNCGCTKLYGQVGKHGWHWWIVTRRYLMNVQKGRWRIENPVRPYTEFRYDPSMEASYLGQLEAAERCPAYVAATARAGAFTPSKQQAKRSGFRS